MQSLNENLRHGDLKHLGIPLVTVDRFTAKTGESKDVSVVAFYLKTKDAARDMVDFLNFSKVSDIRDVDYSPNSDPEDRYVVFVEVTRNAKLWEDIEQLVNDANRLMLCDDWKLQPYVVDDEFDLFSKEWHEYVPRHSRDYVSRSQFEKLQQQRKQAKRIKAVKEFFENSNALRVHVEEDIITMEDYMGAVSVRLKNLGEGETVMKESNISELAINWEFDPTLVEQLQRIMGSVQVVPIDNTLVLHDSNTNRVMIAEPL